MIQYSVFSIYDLVYNLLKIKQIKIYSIRSLLSADCRSRLPIADSRLPIKPYVPTRTYDPMHTPGNNTGAAAAHGPRHGAGWEYCVRWSDQRVKRGGGSGRYLRVGALQRCHGFESGCGPG